MLILLAIHAAYQDDHAAKVQQDGLEVQLRLCHDASLLGPRDAQKEAESE